MLYDIKNQKFYLDNKYLNLKNKQWERVENIPHSLIEISPFDAIKKLQQSVFKLRTPIGVIGTASPNGEQYMIAEGTGKILANLGLIVLCGGRAGVMQAVCKGVKENNGISIGLLPEMNIDMANEYVSIPLSTGIGFARNALIASSSFCLIAIGGGNGTMSEIAYGLQFGKKVFSIKCDLPIKDIIRCNTIDEIIKKIYLEIFQIEKVNEFA